METVFDHNITEKELEAIFGTKEVTLQRLETLGFDQRSHYNAIYSLYRYRGLRSIAKKYADLIPNDVAKVFGLCNHDFAY